MPCISMPAAVLGAGALGAGGSIFGASEQASAAQSAQEMQWKMFQQMQGNLAPYMTAGKAGLQGEENLLGLGPGGAAGEQKALAATPGYQFTLGQGLQATQNGFAAQGLGSSGAAMKGAANYASGLADTTYQQQLANFANLAGMGENAAAGVGTAGLGAATNAGNAAMGGAAALAGGAVGASNSLSGALMAYSMMGQNGSGGNNAADFDTLLNNNSYWANLGS